MALSCQEPFYCLFNTRKIASYALNKPDMLKVIIASHANLNDTQQAIAPYRIAIVRKYKDLLVGNELSPVGESPRYCDIQSFRNYR